MDGPYREPGQGLSEVDRLRARATAGAQTETEQWFDTIMTNIEIQTGKGHRQFVVRVVGIAPIVFVNVVARLRKIGLVFSEKNLCAGHWIEVDIDRK